LRSTALVSISVGVVVDRCKATSPWADFVWRPTSVLEGVPAAAPWTVLREETGITSFYVGPAVIELHRTETANYISNLQSDAPMLWIVLRPTGAEPPYAVLTVTADPAEGEAMTEAGNDLVETVPMPPEILEALEVFVAEHHVERTFFKRQRDSAAEVAQGGGRRPRETKP
jgi:hypothetical protein